MRSLQGDKFNHEDCFLKMDAGNDEFYNNKNIELIIHH